MKTESELDNQFYILESRLDEAQALIAKLKKKAAKYGCGEVSIEVGQLEPTSRWVKVFDKEIEVKTLHCLVTVHGEAPRVGEHTLVARITHEGGTFFIDTVPGLEADHRFRDGGKQCEHCRSDRQRKDLFVVEQNGEQIQVGRSCLRDYLGIDDPKRVIRKFQWLKEVRELEEYGYSEHSDDEELLPELLAIGCAAERQFTFVSKSLHDKLYDQADLAMDRGEKPAHVPQVTSWRVNDALHPEFITGNQPYDIERRKDADDLYNSVNDDDKAKANQVTEWVRAELNGDNDYIFNLKQAYASDYVLRKRLALALSAIGSFNHDRRIKAERTKQQDEYAASVHVGAIKERLRGIGGVVKFRKVVGESQWGVVELIKILTDDGNLLNWFTGSAGEDFDLGNKVMFDGTVKNHDSYKGIAQTIITRVKSLSA
jgi:hypothetical protein